MPEWLIVLISVSLMIAFAYWLDHGNDEDELNESDKRFADSHRIPWGER